MVVSINQGDLNIAPKNTVILIKGTPPKRFNFGRSKADQGPGDSLTTFFGGSPNKH